MTQIKQIKKTQMITKTRKQKHTSSIDREAKKNDDDEGQVITSEETKEAGGIKEKKYLLKEQKGDDQLEM